MEKLCIECNEQPVIAEQWLSFAVATEIEKMGHRRNAQNFCSYECLQKHVEPYLK